MKDENAAHQSAGLNGKGILIRTVQLLIWGLLFYAGVAYLNTPLSPTETYPRVFSVSIPPIRIAAVAPPAETAPDLEPDENSAEQVYIPLIHAAARRHEVDPDMVRAIIKAESSYNPRAVSNRGARGLMQLMPRTAAALGVEDPFDPEFNIEAGVRYYKKLLDRFQGNARLALAAYNAGSRKVRKYNGIPPFEATRNYVKKVFQYYQDYKSDGQRLPGSI